MARPKKKILLVTDANETFGVVLRIRGYDHRTATSESEACASICAVMFDCILIDGPTLGAERSVALCAYLKTYRDVPIVLLCDDQGGYAQAFCDASLDKKDLKNEMILETIRFRTTRKRGPRRGSHHRIVPISFEALP